jgi:hypothetical protein
LDTRTTKDILVYTHLVSFHENEYVSQVAWTLEEGCKLVEAGFEYVTEIEGGKIFLKKQIIVDDEGSSSLMVVAPGVGFEPTWPEGPQAV